MKVLPYVEQGPLYNRVDFRGPMVEWQLWVLGYGNDNLGWAFTSWGGTPNPPLPANREPIKQIAGFRCPSDDYVQSNASNSNYCYSIGSHPLTWSGDPSPCQNGYEVPDTWSGANAGYFRNSQGRFGTSDNQIDISGPTCMMAGASELRDITDGTSNTIAVGEVRPRCSDNFNGYGWASALASQAATVAPINWPTCPGDGNALTDSGTVCYRPSDQPMASGFKSRHPGGAMFVFCDGAVHFLSQTLNYDTYQRLGDKHDGRTVPQY